MGNRNAKVAAEESPQTNVSGSDSNHPDNKPLKHEGWSDIREKKRHCTDCLFLLLLIGAWIAMTVVGFLTTGLLESNRIKVGNPARLTNAMDHDGRICGYDSGVASKPYGYYLPEGLTAACVASCPSSTDVNQFICISDSRTVDANANLTHAVQYILHGECMYQIKTRTFLNRCLPDTSTSDAATAFAVAAVNQTLSSNYAYSFGLSHQGWFYTFAMDIYNLRGYVFGFGIGIATFFAFVYTYLLRLPGVLFVITWTCLLGVLILILVMSFLLWSLSVKWSTDGIHSSYEVVAMQVFAYFGMAVSLLYFCLLVVMRKRIQLAIGIIKESARAVAAIPVMILMPVLQVTGVVAFLVPWTIYVIYLASSGDLVVVNNGIYSYRQFQYDDTTKYTFLYLLFCWFWTSQFIVALGQLVVALAVVAWYFNKNKASVGNHTFLWALRTSLRYHLGTIAFGSLIIAIIQTIRAVIAYFQKQAKDSHNKLLQWILACLQCCMWCLEKIMKFINKNAYIQTAIYSYSFCKASRSAFFLLLRNVLRVSAVNMISSFVLFIGKILVPIVTTFILYLVLAYNSSLDMTSIMSPLVITFILAYFVSSMFNEIFGMAIETVLCCYVADEEMFPPENRFAEGELKAVVNPAIATKVQVSLFA